MSKAIIQITIRKDDDSSYVRHEPISVDYDVYCIIDDGMETCTADEYRDAWLRFFIEILRQVSNLPDNWYLDSPERKLVECY